MDNINVPASITLERGFATQRYRWKSKNKISNYKRISKRAFIRFTCRKFADKISKFKRNKRQIKITFLDNSSVDIRRLEKKCVSLQGYSGNHPYIQIIANKCLPLNLREKLNNLHKKSITYPITISLDLNEWRDINLQPSDFLLEVESEAKLLMDKALKRGLSVLDAPKGREYDLKLNNSEGREFVIAISSHVAASMSRSKEKTVQKILMDISKMLPYLDKNKRAVPVVITRPIEFEGSWSFTTQKYLDFYKEKFGFRFLTTEFKKGWEDDIIKELLKV